MAQPTEQQGGRPAEAGETAETASPGGRRLPGWLPRVGIFTLLAVAAVGVAFFGVRPYLEHGAAEAKPKAREKFGRVLALEPVVVNLAQTEGRRYLKATVHLEIAEEEKVAKEVEVRKPQIQDLLVSTFSRKSLADATAPEALDRLRAETLERLTQALGPGRVQRVFITEFVVQ